MNNYMLISVCDREILTELFKTKEEAQKVMHKEMMEWGKVPDDIFDKQEYNECDFGFGEYSAFANDGLNHGNFDWLIVAL